MSSAKPLVECVPNFSTADPAVVAALVEAVEQAGDDVRVLDRTSDRDHARSVITFAGSPEAVRDAAVRVVREAVERIDLRTHTGVHPRIGAADVVPFVPVEGYSLAQAAALAHQAGARIYRETGVPIYFYEFAALAPGRENLAVIRKGGLAPDLGGPQLSASAGATVIGARRFLIAYNIDLETADIAVAKSIAHAIRERDGGLRAVKALGLYLAERGCAQVSMNLVNHRVTGIDAVTAAVEREAARRGVRIRSTELIGLRPEEVAERFRLVSGAR